MYSLMKPLNEVVPRRRCPFPEAWSTSKRKVLHAGVPN